MLPTGNDDTATELRSHVRLDWAYVLNGTLRLLLADQDLILKASKAVEFDTLTAHCFGTTSSGPVEYLSLFGRQGQRAHIRATTDSQEPAQMSYPPDLAGS